MRFILLCLFFISSSSHAEDRSLDCKNKATPLIETGVNYKIIEGLDIWESCLKVEINSLMEKHFSDRAERDSIRNDLFSGVDMVTRAMSGLHRSHDKCELGCGTMERYRFRVVTIDVLNDALEQLEYVDKM